MEENLRWLWKRRRWTRLPYYWRTNQIFSYCRKC